MCHATRPGVCTRAGERFALIMANFSLQGMVDWAAEWCNKPNVGYSMTFDYRNMGLKDGYITCFDCASFVFFAIWLGGGFDIGTLGYPTDLEKYKTMHGQAPYNAWDVSNMRRRLPYIGFNKIEPMPDVWKTGDILVVIGKHTEICYAPPRRTMGAHSSKPALPDQVSINAGNSNIGYYNEIWRFDNGEPPIIPPTPPDPSNPGNPGGSGVKTRMPLWMMCKPWWLTK